MSSSQYKFKSSGFRTTNRRFERKKSLERPIGIKTPLEEGNDFVKMHVSPIRQITDNFRNLIMTNHGERLGLFDFGANLNAIVFEYSNSANFEQIVNEAIVNATQKFIPSIVITSTSAAFVDASEKDDTNRLGLSKVRIRIEYVIPKFKSPNLALEVDINAGG